METELSRLMAELAFREKSLEELQEIYMRSVREEMEFGQYSHEVSERYKVGIEIAEKAIASLKEEIVQIKDNEEFFSRFGKELHDLYKSDYPGFRSDTTIIDVITYNREWRYEIPGEPLSVFDLDVGDPRVGVAQQMTIGTVEFVTYGKKTRGSWVTLGFAPEINTVFVRRT